MMDNNDYNHFVCIVAGDNPDELIAPYQIGVASEYIKFYFKDAEKIRDTYIAFYKKLLDNHNLNLYEKMILEEELDGAMEDTPEEFFELVTHDYAHNSNGDAIAFDNPNGKYTYCNIGQSLSIPFTLNDGSEAFQATKGDVNWSKMHMNNTEPYDLAWELVMNHKKISNPKEQAIYDNMKDMTHYFEKFVSKENYIANSCAFWGYAFLSEETGWLELEPNVNQFEWVSCFFEKFIVPLQKETKLTIYECKR